MTRKVVQHIVEEADAGMGIGATGAVDFKSQLDRGLARRTLDGCIACHARAIRVWAITWSNSSPLVETAFGPWIVGLPIQSVKVPPASSRMGRSAAQSQTFMTGSSIISARPVATIIWP